MKVHPAKFADFMRRRDMMAEAMAAEPIDAVKLARSLTEGVQPVDFVVGRRYRILTFGSAPVKPPDPTDEAKTADVVEWLTGLAYRDMMARSYVQEVEGVYRGRQSIYGAPHVFRMRNGMDAVLGDIDVLDWERA